MKELLKINNLSVSFLDSKEFCAVRNISFELFQDEILVIVGESGSGKSVTAKQIAGLLPENANVCGSIIYDDEDLCKLSDSKMCKIRGKEISIIFQDSMSGLNPTMTVEAQIREAITSHNKISKKESQEKVIEILRDVNLTPPKSFCHRYSHELSGGQRQRVMIAMAIACGPKILIADEPTTALDITTQAGIIDLLLELKRKNRLSVIFITHDLSVASQLADRVAVMYAGEIVEIGTKHQVFNKPIHPYTQFLVNSQLLWKNERKSLLPTVKGKTPSPSDKIEGCLFAPRCDFAKDICFNEHPYNNRDSKEHYALCWQCVDKKDL